MNRGNGGDSTGPRCGLGPAAGGAWVDEQAAVGDRVGGDRVFEESVEEQAAAGRPPPVETERELVEVRVEVLVADPTLVGAQ